MDERTQEQLAQVLDMDENELRAALIAILNGSPVDEAIAGAYNYMRRALKKFWSIG